MTKTPKSKSPCPTIRFTGAVFTTGAYRDEKVMTVATTKSREIEARYGEPSPGGSRRFWPAVTEYKAGKYTVCAGEGAFARRRGKPTEFWWSDQPCEVEYHADLGRRGYSSQKWVTLHDLAKHAVADGCEPREAPSLERAQATTGLVVRGGRGVSPDAVEVAKRSLQRFAKSILGEPLARECSVDVSFCSIPGWGGDCTCADPDAETPRKFRVRLARGASAFDAGSVLAHELQHVVQLATGRLQNKGQSHVWEGTSYPPSMLKRIAYHRRPWEQEANATQARSLSEVWEVVREIAGEPERKS